MSAEQVGPAKMRAITISREYGSGGGEIAVRLARRLGWLLIDHEVVAQVAHELGITEEEAEVHDEQVESFVSRLLNTMHLIAPNPPIDVSSLPAVEEDAYFEALRRVVTAAADTGHVVIVGRAGQVLLKDRRDVLHVRVVAPLERRVTYVARREGLDQAGARERIRLKDASRARFLQARYHCRPNDPLYYDLVVNTGVLDLESAVELICLALERKARRLAVPERELGPAAGLGRYPGQPADLPSPGSGAEEQGF
jgi:CMP/dCMP kinase